MIRIIQQARQHLAKGNFEETFQDLQGLFETDSKYNELANALLQYQTQYTKVKEDELQGVITIDEVRIGYNRVTRGLTDLMDKVEKGDLTGGALPADPNAPTIKQMRPLLLILVVGIIGYFVYFNVVNKPHTPPNKPPAEAACPDFDEESRFNILILPFVNLGGQEARPHTALSNRLNMFSDRYALQTDAEIFKIKTDAPNYPSGNREAEEIGNNCQSRLIIWGSYEKMTPSNTIINTQFQFLNEKDQLSYQELYIDENNRLDTISSISSIASNGVISSSLEDYISRILLGVAANQLGEDKVAIKLLTSAKAKDPQIKAMKEMALADSYIATGNIDKATRSYSAVLKVDPSNKIALQNRATIFQTKGKYVEALKDFDHLLKDNPRSENAHIGRNLIYIEMDKLDAANSGLEEMKRKGIAPKRVKKMKERIENPRTDRSVIDRGRFKKEELRLDSN